MFEKIKEIEVARINNINKNDISSFYTMVGGMYSPRTFNKCMNGVKFFFDFLLILKILRKRTMRIMYLKLLLQLRVLQKKRI
jgi:hypothetical protein